MNDLRSLILIWYKKLKDEGFNDCEILMPSGQFHDLLRGRIKVENKSDFKEKSEMIFDYYSAAREFHSGYDFKSARDSIAWDMLADGHTYEEIGAVLKVSRATVMRIVVPIRDGPFAIFLRISKQE